MEGSERLTTSHWSTESSSSYYAGGLEDSLCCGNKYNAILVNMTQPRLLLATKTALRYAVAWASRHSPVKLPGFGWPIGVDVNPPWLCAGVTGNAPEWVKDVVRLPQRPMREIRPAQSLKTSDSKLWQRFTRWTPNPRFVATLEGARASRISVISPEGCLIWPLSFAWNVSPHKHPLLTSPVLGPAMKLSGKCLFLSTDAASNYWHWLTDVLQKLKVTDDAGMDVASFDWILVNSKARRFQQESLSLLGIPLEKIVETDVHTHVHAEHLVVPSWSEQSGIYDHEDLEWLRKRLIKRDRFGSRTFPKRFIISRAKAKNRVLLNEPELADALRSAAFVPVELEALSLSEQIQLFAGAEALMGPHGAGFANIMFCDQGTKVVEFVNPNFAHQMFYYMASVLGLDYRYLVATASENSDPQKQDLQVDVELVKEAVLSW